MFLICSVNDNAAVFDIIFLAVGLVIILYEGCDLYKSQRQAGFRKRGHREPHIIGPPLAAAHCIQGW